MTSLIPFIQAQAREKESSDPERMRTESPNTNGIPEGTTSCHVPLDLPHVNAVACLHSNFQAQTPTPPISASARRRVGKRTIGQNGMPAPTETFVLPVMGAGRPRAFLD